MPEIVMSIQIRREKSYKDTNELGKLNKLKKQKTTKQNIEPKAAFMSILKDRARQRHAWNTSSKKKINKKTWISRKLLFFFYMLDFYKNDLTLNYQS